jgi:SAM-dependent MidA family methyltransferase
VDYGYDAPGFGETLQAVRSHQFADVLSEPGASDLSAHVDFTALGDAAERGGACVCGPQPQGAFLVELGLLQRAERMGLFEDARRLTSAEQMGTLFKALAILPKSAPTPPGF